MIGTWVEKGCLAVPLVRRWYLDHYVTIKHLEKGVRYRLGIPCRPISVTLFVTYECNFACEHCEATSHPKADRGLSLEIIARLIREIADLKAEHLAISGGEPLVRQDLFDIIDLAHRTGLEVHLATNGSLVEQHREQLARAKLASVFTSVDGLEETNDRFRRHQGAFKKTFRALELFRDMGIRDRTVKTVVHPGNLHEMEELGDWMMGSAATNWRIALAYPSGRAKGEDRFCLPDDQVRWLLEFIAERRKHFPVMLVEENGYVGPWALRVRPRPFTPWEGVRYCVIMPTGDVLGSVGLHDAAYSEGNVRRQPLKEIWRNGFQRYRQPILPEACYECRYFHACRGGTFGMRVGDRHCMKRLWEGGGK